MRKVSFEVSDSMRPCVNHRSRDRSRKCGTTLFSTRLINRDDVGEGQRGEALTLGSMKWFSVNHSCLSAARSGSSFVSWGRSFNMSPVFHLVVLGGADS